MNAETLNNHLRDGGMIQITTYGHSTIYTPKNAGWFTTGKDQNVYVQAGRKRNCLTCGNGKVVMVGIRFSVTP